MPFVYFHLCDGQLFFPDRFGKFVANESGVQTEAKKILARRLMQSPATSETFGLSVEAQDLSGRILFQVSVVGATW
ncbi:DUF6894 family protein [Pararhizobium arenae]|uniref:DUF6894 family protein n=1 Tax=Pararhizobium arenae TaxID=1856850 RepID=UPI00094B5A0E|nr:hypothetical protein [Pararhizobium arenae]